MRKRLRFLITGIASLAVFTVLASLQPLAQVATQGLPARFIATFPGTGVESSAILGEVIRTATKGTGTITLAGQIDHETPVTVTINREIFIPSPITGLITPDVGMFEAGRITYWNGSVYSAARTLEHEAVLDGNIEWSDYVDANFDGVVESRLDLAGLCNAAASDHYRYVRDQLHGWYRCARIGLLNYTFVNGNPTSYGVHTAQVIGLFASEQEADAHATALYQIAYWSDADTDVPQIVTTFTTPTAAQYGYHWEPLVDVSAWALSGDIELIPIGKLVHGTPGDGQVAAWSVANSRLEWSTSLTTPISPGTSANQVPVWAVSQSRYLPTSIASLLGVPTWVFSSVDQVN